MKFFLKFIESSKIFSEICLFLYFGNKFFQIGKSYRICTHNNFFLSITNHTKNENYVFETLKINKYIIVKH